uniref:Uncharacterized protein n=1 Tax=Glossina brevipalpis TaxID=37001 RepID=A0A1A9WXY0_9MUSC
MTESDSEQLLALTKVDEKIETTNRLNSKSTMIYMNAGFSIALAMSILISLSSFVSCIIANDRKGYNINKSSKIDHLADPTDFNALMSLPFIVKVEPAPFKKTIGQSLHRISHHSATDRGDIVQLFLLSRNVTSSSLIT